MSHDEPVDIKQRIVGAIVIISLAIIVLPIFLGTKDVSNKQAAVKKVPVIPRDIQNIFIEHEKKINASEPAPKLPVADAIPVDEPSSKNTAEKTDSVQQLKTTEAAVYNNVEKPKGKQINAAYTIQLGSFSKQDNAYQLRKKLRASRLKAYIEKIRLTNGQSYRVRVGPFLKYDQAALMHRRIKRQFKIDGKIVDYN